MHRLDLTRARPISHGERHACMGAWQNLGHVQDPKGFMPVPRYAEQAFLYLWYRYRHSTAIYTVPSRGLQYVQLAFNCRWGRTIRQHVQGGLQLHLRSSSELPDCAAEALTELFTADRRRESNDTWLDAPLTLTFGTVSNLNTVASRWGYWSWADLPCSDDTLS